MADPQAVKIFALIARNFWLVAIVTGVVNYVIFRMRASRHIQEKPELADGYARLIRGYLLWTNIPWAIMGIGCTIGGIPTLFHFFRPQDGNPYVLAWFASFFFIWIAGTYWLFFRDGAEMLVRHPGAFNVNFSDPKAVKLLWFVSLACGIIAVIAMWTMDIPVPQFLSEAA